MEAIYPDLSGARVFVTGGATGIGAAIVRAFAAQGARPAFIDIAAADGAALARETGAWFQPCDVTGDGALARAVAAAADALGGLDVLVNNVARDDRADPATLTAEGWRATLAVTLDPAFLAAQAAYPRLKAAGGGAIVMLGSITSLLGPADMPAYAAAKGAIVTLTKSLARAWGPDRVRVNAVLPGWVATARQRALWLTPQAEAAWSAAAALPDWVQEDDVAAMALFLASRAARAVTGQAFIVDAGRT